MHNVHECISTFKCCELKWVGKCHEALRLKIVPLQPGLWMCTALYENYLNPEMWLYKQIGSVGPSDLHRYVFNLAWGMWWRCSDVLPMSLKIKWSSSFTVAPGNIGRPVAISYRMQPTPLKEEGNGANNKEPSIIRASSATLCLTSAHT